MLIFRHTRKGNAKTSVKTLSWLISSNIIKSISQWLILVILVKFFATEDVGYFTYGMAIAAPIFMFSEMQMKSVLVVEPNTGRDYFQTYLAIRFIATTFAVIGLLIYCFLYREINWIVISVIFYKGAESMIDILYGYMQRKDKMELMSQSDIAKTVLTILVFLAVTIAIHKAVSSILSLAIISVVFYVLNCAYIYKKLYIEKIPISVRTAVDIIKKCLPLGISVLFGSYITNYPRIAIESHLGPEMLAYFGAYSYLTIGLFQINAPIQTFLRQRLSKSFQTGNKRDFILKINYSIVGFIVFGALLAVAFYLTGNTIIRVLYSNDYVEHLGVVFYLILSQLLMTVSGIYATAVLSFNIYTKQAIISFAIFVIVLLTSAPLISNFGIYGASYVSVIAAITSMVLYMFLYYKRLSRWKVEN